MIIGGLQKTSIIDYPGKVSCVLFCAGCNFRCPYCHNPELLNTNAEPPLSVEQFFQFLETRRDFLDGVVITGGEPTLQNDLAGLCEKIKKEKLSVKLDTNGSRPGVIRDLLEKGLLDYIAMDVKTDPKDYFPILTKNDDPKPIRTSLELIQTAGVAYEFRTTCVRPLVDEKIMATMAELVAGAPLYVLQRFRHREKILSPAFFHDQPDFSERELEQLQAIVAPRVKQCLIR